MWVSKLTRAYQWVQAMSLDVVLGSGLLSLAIARYYQVELPFAVVACLMIAVWLIYTFDHLSDARKVRHRASTYRHRFHQQHFRKLSLSMLPVAVAGLAAVFFLPLVVIKWGLLCAAVVILYFLILRLRTFWFKEFFIAACYTLGVFLGPLSLLQQGLSLAQWLFLPQILLLALANLIIFSCFDYQSDKEDGHSSLAVHLGLLSSRRLAFGLLAGGLILSFFLFFTTGSLMSLDLQPLIILMNLLLLVLLLRGKYFQHDERYRVVGDGIFFIPALILLYAG